MLSRGPIRGQLFRKAKAKSLRMTSLIVIAFIVCWTPYYVFFITFTFATEEFKRTLHQEASLWIFFFGMANSMLNPLIYGAFHICGKRRYVYIVDINTTSLKYKIALNILKIKYNCFKIRMKNKHRPYQNNI